MKFFKKSKGLTLADLQTSAIALIILVITVVMGSKILSQVLESETPANATATGYGYAYNITAKGISAMGTFGDWFGILVIVIIAVVVIGLLVSYFSRVR